MGVFGNLRQVNLRDLWKNEASDFTVWLSHRENLDMLAGELQIQLEMVEKEKPIGGFSAAATSKPSPRNSLSLWVDSPASSVVCHIFD
jgi:hypothetical protein